MTSWIKKTGLFLILTIAASISLQAQDLSFITLNDSISYVREGDKEDIAKTLDIKAECILPSKGINPAHLAKMYDMLFNIAGVNFDEEGYLTPSPLADYEGGKWVPATTVKSQPIMKGIQSGEISPTQLWSEEPVIKPVYQDEEFLSMLASDYIYTGGAHGMYTDYCVNYDLRRQDFIYLKDIFPGLDTPKGKELYTKALEPVLTRKAKEIVSSDDGMDLLVDAVSPTTNFAMTKDGIVMRFQPYEIAPWAAGVVEIPLSKQEIHQIVNSVKF